MIDLFTHLPTTAYPPGTMGVTASPEFTPSGNHVAMASPTSRPNAAPEDEKSDTDVWEGRSCSKGFKQSTGYSLSLKATLSTQNKLLVTNELTRQWRKCNPCNSGLPRYREAKIIY